MRKFLIGFFAVIGFIVVAIAVIMISFASTKQDRKNREMPSHMVLTLDLKGNLDEATVQPSVLDTLSEPVPTLQDIVQTLDLARQDSRIVGIAVHLDEGQYGVAMIQELRDAIARFKRSGKFAYIYADTMGDSPAMGEYWLASSFDEVWLQPLGEVAITGFSAEIPFARDLLNKLGVEPEMIHQGKYKSFPESIMRNSISPENREMTTALLDELQTQFDKAVLSTRKIDANKLHELMSQAPISSDAALKAHLIDKIGYRDEFDAYLEQKTGGAEAMEFADYQNDGPRGVPGEKIALVNVLGALTNVQKEDAKSGDVVSASEISEAIQDAGNQSDIKAIVVRVDSPGGTPLAADMIRHAIEVAKQQKPVVISMGDTAASGGYWMSCDADKIIAQPGTLTGSIGVFGGKVNLQELWKKLGIHWDEIGDSDNNSMWSMNQPFSDKAKAKIETSMEKTYSLFINHVATGRNMKPEKVQEIAQGRVWTGSQGLKNGLVDQLGGLDTAMASAKDLAKIPSNHPINLEIFPKPLNPIEQLVQMIKQGVPFHLLGASIQDGLNKVMSQKLLATTPVIK
jgi:protease-4